jgi:flavin-dependent dehydrogenase
VIGAAQSTAHLVIGGGLAGSMVGLRLAEAGREVTLLERERTPHNKVCGEFLSREAVEYLEAVGVRPLDLGARAIRSVRLSAKGRTVETALPFTALSLSRAVLDEALLVRAVEAGCRVERGAWVEQLEPREGQWHAQLRGGTGWVAPRAFLASGKHDVRGLERKLGPHGDLIGFKLHFKLSAKQTDALRGCMELFIFPGGYGGLSLIEGDAANFCLVVRKEALQKKGGWPELLASVCDETPHVALRLEGSTALWEKPLAVSSIPYGHLGGRPDGLWCVGDQAACIPSFTGDGMSIALHSGALAAQMALSGQSADDYHRALREHLSGVMRLATLLSRAMVTGAGRWLAPAGLAVFPQAMNWIAASTRIPERALKQTMNFAPIIQGPGAG